MTHHQVIALLALVMTVTSPFAQTDTERALCLKQVSECQTVCDKIYKGDAWVGCRANCGNSGSCPETKRREKQDKRVQKEEKQSGRGVVK